MSKQFLFLILYCIVRLNYIDTAVLYNNNNSHYNESSMYYYNIETGAPLCGVVIPVGRRPAEKIIFRRQPCSCGNLSCGCCAGINLTQINFNRRACTKFTYDPLNFAINMEVSMNEKVIFSRKLSGKNPPPICIPLPYLPAIDFCVRFFNIFTPGQNLHACIDFETRLVQSPVLILHFDCIRVGADGVAWLKPEENSGLNNLSSNGEYPYYDEVDFQSDNAFSSLCNTANHNSTLDDDHMIGQLKE